jgi:flotillin
VQTEAEASKFKFETEARGQAEAKRVQGIAQADVVKATGGAEAQVIALKGSAEAEAMAKKAASWKEYNQAAVIQLVLQALPELAQAIAAPLGKTESITIVSTGAGDAGAGASKVTRDVAEIMAQLPPIVEGLSGLDLKKLVDLVPQLRADKKAGG